MCQTFSTKQGGIRGSKMKKKGLVAALFCVALAGCQTTPPPVVIGHCELPEKLKELQPPLDETKPGWSLKQQHQQWIKDRGHAAKSDYHIEQIIKHVEEHCQ